MEKTHDDICLWDLDGTLADLSKAMDAQLKKIEGPFKIPKYEGRRPDWLEARRSLIKKVPGFWRNLERVPLGFELLNIARGLKFENHVLTKGPSTTNSAWTEKKEWCDEHVPDLDVHISQKKSLLYGKILVDDWPGYFLPWLKVRPRGIVITIAQSWNKDVDHPRVFRYDGNNLELIISEMTKAKNR
jgi:hypothetical protein